MNSHLWLLLVVTVSWANAEPTSEDYCTEYSQCRANAHSQLLKCAGDFMRMVISKYEEELIHPSDSHHFQVCEKRISQRVRDSIQSDYASIEKQTAKCMKSAKPSAMEKAQQSICRANYDDIVLDSIAIQGSGVECHQAYAANIRRCELVRDCCPQHERCRIKAENEVGVGAKERVAVDQLRKCIVGIRTGARQQPRVIPPGVRTATPVPRMKNGTRTKHGMFLIKRFHIPKKAAGKPVKVAKEEPKAKLHAAPTVEIKRESSAKKGVEQKLEEFKPQPPLKEVAVTANEQLLQEVFCRQHFECQSIVRKEELECEHKFGGAPDASGIEDAEIRAIFLNNSRNADTLIRRKCLDHIDEDTQKHLVYLKKEVAKQNQQCAFKTTAKNIDFGACPRLELLTELSAIQTSGKDQFFNSLDQCKQRIEKLRQKCQALAACCPQRLTCEQTNGSKEHQTFRNIAGQLKLEQILCERRLQRVHDGMAVA